MQAANTAALAAALASLAPAIAGAEQPPRPVAPPVEVVGVTPLPGIGLPADRLPANVQSATDTRLRQRAPTSIADFLNQDFNSVHINEAQSNPFQPDVSFRGFTASPLLGNPIGMSVYVDGVRVNESFGDTVLWDLIPDPAIAGIDLIPGSNPVFGLNTLGGTLALRTQSGRSHPGLDAAISGGSFGRRAGRVAYGAAGENADVFVAGQLFDEDGWRDHSLSRVRQWFAKAGWQDASTDVSVSYTYADNTLVGNGLVPESLLRQRRSAVYTHPDETRPELHFFNLSGQHVLSPELMLSGNVYHRRVTIGTFNGDAEFDDGGTPLDITDDEYEAENRRTRTRQRTRGVALQLAYTGRVAGMDNQVTVGTSRDSGTARFEQLEQEADFTDDRGTVGESEVELDTHVRGRTDYTGFYVTDTLSLTESLHLTLSGRYNRARVELEDLTGEQPELNGRHAFSRFNPAAGAAFAVTRDVTLFGGYSEGFRVPTPVELSCADPAAPCSLPVAFVADPPLDPVVAKSWEVGARGRVSDALRWNVTAYRTHLQDDILFTSLAGSQGFFANVPRTRRQGLELGFSGQLGKLDWSANYAHVEATFESPVQLFNPVAHPTDATQPETISVRRGDRMPGIPRHMLKLTGNYQVSGAFNVGMVVHHASSQFLRGDEGNRATPLSGYTVAHLNADYRFAPGWKLFFKVENLFDRKYATLAAFNRNAFDAASEPLEGVGPGPVERFVSPGARRGVWLGIEYRFGAEG